MYIYSNTIIAYLKRLRADFREIMSKELGIQVYKTRFCYRQKMIPYDLVVFEGESCLGHFEAAFYRIAINKKLMFHAKNDVIKNILRHEIMHFISWLDYGDVALNHLDYFKSTCQKFNMPIEVMRAYTNIELANNQIPESLKNEKILEKVKKLLKLSSSDNPNEAKLATEKANELLLNHNLELLAQKNHDVDDEVYVLRVLSGQKSTAKHQAIYEILKTFFVSPVFNYGRGIFYLEVTGSYTNTQMAEYVAHFLDQELERIYKLEKKLHPSTKKPSFMRGVGMGYTEKISANQLKQTTSYDLIALKNVLKEQTDMVYQRLTFKRNHSSTCIDSLSAGKKAGKNLSIHPAIKKESFILKLLS